MGIFRVKSRRRFSAELCDLREQECIELLRMLCKSEASDADIKTTLHSWAQWRDCRARHGKKEKP